MTEGDPPSSGSTSSSRSRFVRTPFGSDEEAGLFQMGDASPTDDEMEVEPETLDFEPEVGTQTSGRTSVEYVSPTNERSRRSTIGEAQRNAAAQMRQFQERTGGQGLLSPLPLRAEPTATDDGASAASGRSDLSGGSGNPSPLPPRTSSPRVQSKSKSRSSKQKSAKKVRITQPKVSRPKTVVIDGIDVPVRDRQVDPASLSVAKTWNKLERHMLEHEDKAHFVRSATSMTVLSKSNKLNIYSLKDDDEGMLENVRNTQLQLRLLRNHAYNHDIGDVFIVVVPTNVNESSDISSVRYNLFEDFAKLDVAMVATSNAWYNTWVDCEYIRENMAYTFTLLQNNTDESLWNKCLEEYEAYHPIYQGGPLMLYLILKRIQSNSENSIVHLQTRVKNLKIRDIKGEDVDLAVSLIRSTYKALSQASIEDRNYVPDDFPKTVLQVLQTSSVKAFNDAFAHEETVAQHEADKFGGKPNWPTVEHILNLATNTYHRLHKTNKWQVQRNNRGYNANVSDQHVRIICWNCGGNHPVQDCDKPHDPDKIAAARKAFYDRKNSNNGGRGRRNGNQGRGRRQGGGRDNQQSDNRQRKIGDDGTPLVMNVKGEFVPDQKKIQEQKHAEQQQVLEAAIAEAEESTQTSPSQAAAHIARLKDAVAKLKFN